MIEPGSRLGGVLELYDLDLERLPLKHDIVAVVQAVASEHWLQLVDLVEEAEVGSNGEVW